MELKRIKPITPSLRHRVWLKGVKNGPFTPLLEGKSGTGFRNNQGRITVRHRGGGHKRRLRIIDIGYENAKYAPYEVVRHDYDPHHSALLALCKTTEALPESGENLEKSKTGIWISGHKYFYRIATDGVKTGTIINKERKIGNTLALKDISVGTEINNIEIKIGGGSKICRSAGTYGVLIDITKEAAIIKLPSNKIINVPSECLATIGRVSNPLHNLTVLGKAGAARWMGRRPVVRGEAMNPVDHPLGGKTRGGRPLKNLWGKLAKWVPTSRSIRK